MAFTQRAVLDGPVVVSLRLGGVHPIGAGHSSLVQADGDELGDEGGSFGIARVRLRIASMSDRASFPTLGWVKM